MRKGSRVCTLQHGPQNMLGKWRPYNGYWFTVTQDITNHNTDYARKCLFFMRRNLTFTSISTALIANTYLILLNKHTKRDSEPYFFITLLSVDFSEPNTVIWDSAKKLCPTQYCRIWLSIHSLPRENTFWYWNDSKLACPEVTVL